MAKQTGKLVVIEGTDGSGKTEAANLLVKRLRNCGFSVVQRDFPSYGKLPEGNPASYFVRKYLRKKEFGFEYGYGPSTSVDPHVASQFYALERFDAAFSQEPADRPNLWESLNSGQIVISNRYVESNLGHQGAKLQGGSLRETFMRWAADLEYNFYRIPRPDLVILLDVIPRLAVKAKEAQRQSQGISKDGHEADEKFIFASRGAYLDAARLFNDYWEVVPVWRTNESNEPNELVFRDLRDIQRDIWSCLIEHGVIF